MSATKIVIRVIQKASTSAVASILTLTLVMPTFAQALPPRFAPGQWTRLFQGLPCILIRCWRRF